MERRSTVTPARRAAKTLRVHARFTPTRSAVHRSDVLAAAAPAPAPTPTVVEPVVAQPQAVPTVVEPAAPPPQTVPTVVEPAVAPPQAVPTAVERVAAQAPTVSPAVDPVDPLPAHGPAPTVDEHGLLETLFALPDAAPDHDTGYPPDPPTPAVVTSPTVGAAPAGVGRRPGRWLPVLVVGVAVLVLVVVLTVRGLTGDTTTGNGTRTVPIGSRPAPAAAPAGLAGWLGAEGAAVKVFVDGAAAADAATAAGVTPTGTGVGRAEPGDRVLRSVPAGAATAVVPASAGAAVVPVISFAAPGGGLLVGGVTVEGTATAVAAARAGAADTARAASEALVRNAAVTLTPAARAVLDSGDVDIRISAFVAALAASGAVQVTSLDVDEAERAVGVAVRAVTLSAAPDDVRDLAARAKGAYKPTSVTSAAEGATTLTWSVEADPTGLTVR